MDTTTTPASVVPFRRSQAAERDRRTRLLPGIRSSISFRYLVITTKAHDLNRCFAIWNPTFRHPTKNHADIFDNCRTTGYICIPDHRATMPRREKYQTRLDSDDARAVESYQAEHDISQSEAVRRLIKDGLEAQDTDHDLDELREDIADLEDELVSRRSDMMSLPLLILTLILAMSLLVLLVV